MLGIRHHLRWLQKHTAIRIFTHHEPLVGATRQYGPAAAIGLNNGEFSHHSNIAHFPTMGYSSFGSR